MCFSAAHLIIDHSTCGYLHGHTYAVHLRVTGTTDDQGFLVDFQKIKQLMRETIKKLDHRMLLPHSKAITKKNDMYIVTSSQKTYQIPESDCVKVPIPSISVENLSKYILSKIVENYAFPAHISEIAVGVDEGPGQGAWAEKKIL